MQAMDRHHISRSKSSAPTSYRGDESDDGRPRSSRSMKRGSRPTISLDDIEAARVAAALGGEYYEQDMAEITDSHRRSRHASGDSRKRRSKSSTRSSSRASRKEELEYAEFVEPRSSSRTSRTSTSRQPADDFSSVSGYATIKRRPKTSRRPTSQASDIDFSSDADKYTRRSSAQSGLSEADFLRMEAERSLSRGSEPPSRHQPDQERSKIDRSSTALMQFAP